MGFDRQDRREQPVHDRIRSVRMVGGGAGRGDEDGGPPANGDEEESADAELPRPWDVFDRQADEVTSFAIEALNAVAQAGKPFFIFLHYYDPHQPYKAPEPFAGQYTDPYLTEIAFFDAQFGILMNALRDVGLDKNTLVILTSDHGESWGERQETAGLQDVFDLHGNTLYEEVLRVPLIIRPPSADPSPAGIAAGQRHSSLVRTVDLLPTLVELLGLERNHLPEDLYGRMIGR